MTKQLLCLRPDSKTPYTVGVRDEKGKLIERDGQPWAVVFKPNTPLEVTDKEFEAAVPAIGGALVVGTPSEENPGTVLVDWEKTAAIHNAYHDKELTPPRNQAINAGRVEQQPDGVNQGQSGNGGQKVPENPGGSGGGETDDVELELDDALVDLLEKNAEQLPNPLTVDDLKKWITEGGQLTTLEGFTIDSAAALHTALGLDPPSEKPSDDQDPVELDSAKLVEAGVGQDLADLLITSNGKEHPWVADPEQLKSKVADGFDLTTLADIGNGRAKQLKAALQIAE